MNLFLSISVSGHQPLPGFVCANPCFAVFLTLIGSIVCDDLSPMTPWGSGDTSSCCDGCCCSYKERLMPWVVNHLSVPSDFFESWGVDNIESAVDMKHIGLIVDSNVKFIKDVGEVVCREVE